MTNGERVAPLRKMKQYGIKGLAPVWEVVQKYQSELGPYFDALERGISAAERELSFEGANESERQVSSWFRQVNGLVTEFKGKWQETDLTTLAHALEARARRSPLLMFSASYVGGLVLGRLGKNLGRGAPRPESVH